jgi:hypothetical protein
MADGFVIMQIGDEQLDRVFEEAVAPAIERVGLTPRRIDLDNEGGLLKSEIVSFLERSDLIVADLTNERPNCYLEVGYAMGLGRNRHMILTVREDHYPGNPGYAAGGPKVHFDLTGYDILFWKPGDLSTFSRKLEERIRRRLAIVGDTGASVPSTAAAPDWFGDAEQSALEELRQYTGGRGFMELAFWLDSPKIERTQQELLEAARSAEIHTFGWPIGVVLDRDEYRPRPTGDGIRARIPAERWGGGEKVYDCWELRVNGDFLLVHRLFEDQRGKSDELFFNTRIVRVSEGVLYCARLYERLGVAPETKVHLKVRYGGIEGRVLTSSDPGRYLSRGYRSGVDEFEQEVTFDLSSVADELVEIVNRFVQGQVT